MFQGELRDRSGAISFYKAVVAARINTAWFVIQDNIFAKTPK